MKILLNNNIEFIHSETDFISINDILKCKNYTFKMLVARVNNNFVPKNQYDMPLVKDNDDVQIIHLISGG